MSSSVRPELLTCVGSSASLQTRPSPLIYRGLTVQTNRATSLFAGAFEHLIGIVYKCPHIE